MFFLSLVFKIAAIRILDRTFIGFRVGNLNMPCLRTASGGVFRPMRAQIFVCFMHTIYYAESLMTDNFVKVVEIRTDYTLKLAEVAFPSRGVSIESANRIFSCWLTVA